MDISLERLSCHCEVSQIFKYLGVVYIRNVSMFILLYKRGMVGTENDLAGKLSDIRNGLCRTHCRLL